MKFEIILRGLVDGFTLLEFRAPLILNATISLRDNDQSANNPERIL
jgi:hypothetical protein